MNSENLKAHMAYLDATYYGLKADEANRSGDPQMQAYYMALSAEYRQEADKQAREFMEARTQNNEVLRVE